MDPSHPPPPPPPQHDEELEAFRRQWRAEVSARARQARAAAPPSARPDNPPPSSAARSDRHRPAPPSASASAPDPVRVPDDADHEPRVYHDLPDRDAQLRLDAADRGPTRTPEPSSALEHYEMAVEKETQGSLGDSLDLYRKAFKLDDAVHEKYKNKHFPPSAFPPKPPPAATQHADAPSTSATAPAQALPPSISQLVQDFSHMSIPGAPPPTDLDRPPPCPIAQLPGELLTDVLTWIAVKDLAALTKVARVCKRFAYLVMADEAVWKRICLGDEFGFGAMHYSYACDLKGGSLEADACIHDPDPDPDQPIAPALSKTTYEIDDALLRSLYASSWRQMFRSRPRLRFNGCYISTVNYTRPGAANTMSATWGTPIHIVTYFRYLRFFRDGSCISLLTTTEPIDVIHHLTHENLHTYQSRSLLPNSVMKDALRGRWRLSGPGDGLTTSEAEGDLHVETDGVVPKYMWKMQFALGSAGKHSARNNKLSWKGFWSYNRLTDDWGEFGLKNDKAFYFSRVKSYAMGY